jgi:hypothetical protein
MDNPFIDCNDDVFDFDKEKDTLINNLNHLKSLSVEEHTFIKKFEEVKGYRKFASKINEVKSKIWKPTDISDEKLTLNEIQSLTPSVVHVNTPELEKDWLILRVFCHTMEFSQSPGRFVKLLIQDQNGKYLGVLSVASDVISMSDRDKYIGWTSDNKLKDKKLANSCIGSCIMSLQPFGYNFLGGKLAACLITSSTVRKIWKTLYNNKLVGMTTTSLYGSFSMYNSLKWWHKVGSSAGQILIKPNDESYNKWHQWIKENRADKYNKAMTQKDGVSGPVTGAKLRVLELIFDSVGIKEKDYVHGYSRGIYTSLFYENSKEFLQNKIGENDLNIKQLFHEDIKSILEWWKPKAAQRYLSLKKETRIKPGILFYDKMVDMTYEQAKNEYLQDVGR